MIFDRDQLERGLSALAGQGIYIGTSSWKYPGWRGQLYDPARYVYRGRLSEARFERQCLSEYAEVFKTVSVDASYYKFPSERILSELASQVPSDFQFAFKVTDDITMKRFPNLPRFGRRAGQPNPHFLNADLFNSAFLKPCEAIRPHVGLLMFEFTRFHTDDFERGREFVEVLESFLERLPGDWRYGVEIRNASFLQPEYFEALAKHRIVHIYNSWDAMPSVAEQLAQPGSRTTPDLVAARLLLRPGRKYNEAVKMFSPYERVQDEYPEGRAGAAQLIRDAQAKKARALIFVNNRFEGSALGSIAGIVQSCSR